MAGLELDEEHMNTREEYFGHMEDHTRDTSSYVRKDVLGMYAELAMPRTMEPEQVYELIANGGPFREPVETYIPIAKHREIMSLCCERLLDKTSSVRKAAISLLRNLAIFSPFHGQTVRLQFHYFQVRITSIVKTKAMIFQRGIMFFSSFFFIELCLKADLDNFANLRSVELVFLHQKSFISPI